MSAIGGKADMPRTSRYVRQWPIVGVRLSCHRGASRTAGRDADILTRINVKCVSYLATSHHIAGASTARTTIGIHMNQAAPAYSPLPTLYSSARPDRVKAAATPAMK